MTDLDAAKIVVKLEQGQVCSSKLDVASKIVDAQTKEILTCSDTIKELDLKAENYAKAIDEKDKLIKDQEIECKKQIDAARGSFWSRLKGNLEVFGAGAVTGILGVVIIILLH